MIYVVLGVIGAIAGGGALDEFGGVLLGGFIGVLAAAAINQRNQVLALVQRLDQLEARLTATSLPETDKAEAKTQESAPQPSPAPVERAHVAVAEPPLERPAEAAVDVNLAARTAEDDLPDLDIQLAETTESAAPSMAKTEAKEPAQPAPPAADGGMGDTIREFFLGGNLLVRAGVVVLLFGFAFLVKYAAARNLIPLELRLAAAFVAGIAMLVIGWRLREKRFGYAVAMQGGGIGVMYLTLFAATRLFDMVPLSLTFGVMVALVVFSGILAVLQNAASMAVLGAAGGFAAPVLLSTGTGSHVALFSYYALLNAGIFGIAWFKAWRWLNLLGFVFTFGIGSAWGVNAYQSHHFATTEPFLILFFGFYLTIAVLFALRQPPQLKGYVDGSLVFGLPLVVFSLQVGLVRQIEYGLAFSALAMGLVYTGLASALWRRRADGLGPLTEAFLALGVVFASLAIPLALSGNWTAVAWSLEGAGLVWVGLRQRRWLARSFGILLQFGAGVMFLAGTQGGGLADSVVSSTFLGGMMIAVAGLLCAFMLERYGDQLHRLEKPLDTILLVWGLLWWFGTGLAEIDRQMARRYEMLGSLLYIGFSVLAMGLLCRRVNWRGLRWPTMGFFPVVILAALWHFDQYRFSHFFQGWWIGMWPALMGIHYFLLRSMEKTWTPALSQVWHVAGTLLLLGMLTWDAAWLVGTVVVEGSVWRFIVWGAIPAAVTAVLMRLHGRRFWPVGTWSQVYCGQLPLILVAGMMLWTFAGVGHSGDPRPLPYLPLIAPLDIVQMIVLLVTVRWLLWFRQTDLLPAVDLPREVLWGVPAAGTFLWISAGVARCVHHYASVPYSDAMFHSGEFHAALAVVWGLLSLVCMVAANRWRLRAVWFAGAGLLAVVVVKLFLVDLSGTGTVYRIISFLAVGGLMLVVGFFTPLPPVEKKEGEN